MAISAQDVKTLREKTGAGLMDCKEALTLSDGDFDKAIKYLREKGLAEARIRTGREAKEGAIAIVYSKDESETLMVEVNCETDFVSRTDRYKEFVRNVAGTLLAEGAETKDAVSENVQTLIKESLSAFGENIFIRRLIRFTKSDPKRSVFQSYIHLDSRVGVVIELLVDGDKTTSNPDFNEFARNVALQVASMGPLFVSRSDFPRKLIEEQKEIFMKQAKESGKPEKVIEKIVQGKMEKFFAENSLLEQKYVKNSDMTIAQYMADTEKKAGGKIIIKRFSRFKLGEEQ